MAVVTTIKGEGVFIQIGNGATPEVFSHPCLINAERGIVFSSNVTSEGVVDCADADAPAWVETDVDDLVATITGSGKLHLPDQDDYFDWWKSGASKNVKVVDNTTGANGGQTFAGAFKLTQFEKTGARRQRVTASITLVSTGAVTRTANS